VSLIKGILTFLIAIWFLGAAGTSIYYKVDEKFDCIQNEGFFKGLLWCDESIKNKFDIANDQTSLFIRGLKWPLILFSKREENDKSIEIDYQCSLLILDLNKLQKEGGTPEVVNRLKKVGDYLEQPKVLKKLSVLTKNLPNKSTKDIENIGANVMSETFSVCVAKPYLSVKSAMIEAVDNL
jgi:hypothetical protein